MGCSNAAEIVIHLEDLVSVIKTVQNKNNKLKAVEADLESSVIQRFLTGSGFLYVKVTGLYWELVKK